MSRPTVLVNDCFVKKASFTFRVAFLWIPTLVLGALGLNDDFHLSDHPLEIIEEAHNWLIFLPPRKVEGGLTIRRSTRAISNCP